MSVWWSRGSQILRYIALRLYRPSPHAARIIPVERLEFRREFLPVRPEKLYAALLVWQTEGALILRELCELVKERRPDVLRALWRYCHRSGELLADRRMVGLIGQALAKERANVSGSFYHWG